MRMGDATGDTVGLDVSVVVGDEVGQSVGPDGGVDVGEVVGGRIEATGCTWVPL